MMHISETDSVEQSNFFDAKQLQAHPVKLDPAVLLLLLHSTIVSLQEQIVWEDWDGFFLKLVISFNPL